MGEEEDTYQHLEDDSGADAIHFVQSANRLTMTALGSPPTTSPSYSKILDVLEEEEKIPLISQLGIDESGIRILLNFWKDDKDVSRPLVLQNKYFDTMLAEPTDHFPSLFVFNTAPQRSLAADNSGIVRGRR